MKKWKLTIFLAAVLIVLCIASLFVGVLDMNVSGLVGGDSNQIETLLISRLPRLLAILCTGIGMSVAGLIMQQLCMNKFSSPTTGATISSAQFGVLLALLFCQGSTLWGPGFVCLRPRQSLEPGFLYWFIQRVQFRCCHGSFG